MGEMPAPVRSVSLDVAPDPTYFNPLQLQPRVLASISLNACIRWLRDFAISHQRMTKQFHAGMVEYAIHIQYLEPLRYHEADSLQVTCSTRVRQDGAYSEGMIDFTAGGKKAARVQLVSVPLWLEDSDELAGVPAIMAPEVLALHRPEELDPTPYQCPVLPLADAAAAGGRLLAEHAESFTLHRHDCDFADMWIGLEALRFCGGVRESLVLEHGRDQPEVRKGLSLSLQSVDLLLSRPLYLFDRFRIQTRAYAADEGLTFVHRLVAENGGALHATVVERF